LSLASRRMFICRHRSDSQIALQMMAVTIILRETSSRHSNC